MTAISRNPQISHRNPNQSFSFKPPRPAPPPSSSQSTQNGTADSNLCNFATISLSQEDRYLSRSSHLTQIELLKRRSHNVKQLSRLYKNHYWALMEEIKSFHREYYWTYGVSPFKDDQLQESSVTHDAVKIEDGLRESTFNFTGVAKVQRCISPGCKSKAMALTQFCHLHILSDPNQVLYKPCAFVIKSAQTGNITCGKAILRTTSPPFCGTHFQKSQKHVTRALKKAGLPVSSAGKLAPKLHNVIAEYVRQIQAKRRAESKR